MSICRIPRQHFTAKSAAHNIRMKISNDLITNRAAHVIRAKISYYFRVILVSNSHNVFRMWRGILLCEIYCLHRRSPLKYEFDAKKFGIKFTR